MFSGKLAPHLTYTTVFAPSYTWANSVRSTTTSPTIGGLTADAFVTTDILPIII